MTRRWWQVSSLLLLGSLVFLAGCAPGEAYRGPEPGGASSGAISPALRGTDPSLRHWYTAPYFDPYEMP
jgi:hypothetical protein